MTWNKEAARRVTSEWGKIGKMERDEADAHVAKIIADTFREEGPRFCVVLQGPNGVQTLKLALLGNARDLYVSAHPIGSVAFFNQAGANEQVDRLNSAFRGDSQ